MPRKRRASSASLQDLDDDDFCTEEKFAAGGRAQDSPEGARAPRNAANARERARMRVLSKAFCRLKTTLPWVPADTKLSKLDTLRLAATYIAHLRAVLRDEGESHPETTRSLSLALSWPFAIQGSGTPIIQQIGNCGSGSSSSTSSSPGTGQYRGQQLNHVEITHNQNPRSDCSAHHHLHSQSIHLRHNNDPSQLSGYY